MNEQEKKMLQAERARLVKARAKRDKNEATLRVRFQNIEDPPAPGRPSPALSFTFEGLVYKESRTEGEPDTALRHGEEYDLPLSVINHLNSVRMPVYSQREKRDPVTGAMKIINYISGYRNRFSLVPVDITAFQKLSEMSQDEPKPAAA